MRRTLPGCNIIEKGLMVKSWETLHIIMVTAKFKKFNDDFQPQTCCVELADDTRSTGITECKGDAEVSLIDTRW